MTRHLLSLCLAATTALAQGAAPAKAAPAPVKPAPLVTFREGLATPESVLYDPATDTYLVSNINGAPLAKDNNGYLTELSPDGAVLRAKLVEGGKNGVTLHAPKGTALHDGVLYVADIDVVRLFDRATGAPKGEVKIPGGAFVNDVALGPDGRVYVSDTGVNARFEGVGKDAVYVLTPGKKATAKPLVKSKELHGPNGVLPTGSALHVVSFATAELHSFDLHGKAQGTVTLPQGGLDGIVSTGDALLVSSWGGKAVYRGTVGGEWKALVTDVEAPADLGFDPKRKRVLIPRFQAHTVEAWAAE